MLVFLVAAVATALLYRFYFQGGVSKFMEVALPGLIEKVKERIPTSARTSNEASENIVSQHGEEHKLMGDCSVVVTSDPSGAEVYVDNKKRGVTSTTLDGNCNKSIRVVFKLTGYEDGSEEIVLKKRESKIHKTLQKIPMGTLELTLTRNAVVYLQDKVVGEAEANKKFDLPLKGGTQYTLRFVNKILGIDTKRTFRVEVDRLRVRRSGLKGSSIYIYCYLNPFCVSLIRSNSSCQPSRVRICLPSSKVMLLPEK